MRLFTRQNNKRMINSAAAILALCLSVFAVFFPTLLQSLKSECRAYFLEVAGKDVPYVPTPFDIVEQMLNIAQVGAADVVYDLGCGDGRIVVAAAKLGARGVGIDIDPERISDSERRAEREKVKERVKFITRDLFAADISEASVVTLYLLPSVNMRLRPKLLKDLKPGARIVSFSFSMGEWEPDKISGLVLYWVVPANVTGQWRWNCARNSDQMTLRLKQKFQKVKGSLSIGGETFPIRNATLSGNELRFTSGSKAPGEKTAVYQCKVAGNELTIRTGSAGLEDLATRSPGTKTDIDGSDF
jgi:SAM-dependent methyltransferase